MRKHTFRLYRWQWESLFLVFAVFSFLSSLLFSDLSSGAGMGGIYSSSEVGSDVLSRYDGVPELVYAVERRSGYRANDTAQIFGYGFSTVDLVDRGLFVVYVAPDSPAERANIVKGDEILAINNTSLATDNSNQTRRDSEIDQSTSVTLSVRSIAGNSRNVILSKEVVTVPVSMETGYISVKDSSDWGAVQKALQDKLDDAEYDVFLSRRAVPVAVFSWLIIDFLFLYVAAKTLKFFQVTNKRGGRAYRIFLALLFVPVLLAVTIALSLFLPPFRTALVMGSFDARCGGFICIDPAPILLFLAYVVLVLINLPVFLCAIRNKSKHKEVRTEANTVSVDRVGW